MAYVTEPTESETVVEGDRGGVRPAGAVEDQDVVADAAGIIHRAGIAAGDVEDIPPPLPTTVTAGAEDAGIQIDCFSCSGCQISQAAVQSEVMLTATVSSSRLAMTFRI